MKAVREETGFTLIETILALAILSLAILTWVGFVSVSLNNKKRVIETDEIQAVRNHVEHTLQGEKIEPFPYDFVYENYTVSINVLEAEYTPKAAQIVHVQLRKEGKKLFTYQTVYPHKG